MYLKSVLGNAQTETPSYVQYSLLELELQVAGDSYYPLPDSVGLVPAGIRRSSSCRRCTTTLSSLLITGSYSDLAKLSAERCRGVSGNFCMRQTTAQVQP